MADEVRRWRSVALAAVVGQNETELNEEWARVRDEFGVTAGSADEQALCWLVADNPQEHAWRVVDAALARLTCPECGDPLAGGRLGCRVCDYYNGVRFAGREVDRPGVPPGNEHAIRVASAVARTRKRYSPRARVGYELVLPDLLAGALPTAAEAQAAKALINKLTPEECDRVTSLADVASLAACR